MTLTLTTHNDHSSYVTHVLAPFYLFFALYALWLLRKVGLGFKRNGHTIGTFSPCAPQNFMFPSLCFFNIMTVYNQHPSYAKDISAQIHVFCNLLGHLGKNPSIRNLFFLTTLATRTDHLGYVKHLLGIFLVFFTQFGCGM